MIWADFFPYVLPAVRGCPEPVAEHHIRLAAIDFCRRTLCWQQLLDPIEGEVGQVAFRLTEYGDARITEDGVRRTTEPIEQPAADGVATEFDLIAPPGAEVVRLLSVTVNGEPVTLVEGSRGVQLVRRSSPEDFAFTRDRKMVYIHPAPPLGASIEIEAALKPTLAAVEFPDDLFDHYAQDIARGAMATLMLLPKQDWTDLGLGAVHQESFDERISTVAAQVARGFARVRSATVAHYF